MTNPYAGLLGRLDAPALVRQDGVQRTAEFLRVEALPRRAFSPADLERLQADVTGWLRTPAGAMTLNPVQAQALFELHHNYGIFCPVRVGGGKTLISLLAPVIANSNRPLLLVPAALVGKTKRDARTGSEHFRIPNWIRIESYELLGRTQSAELLERYDPDLIIVDECHKLKNRKAAVSRRVERFITAHPLVRIVAMSGTVTKRSIKDYAHILRWALRERSPVPLTWAQIEEWAMALDERAEGQRTIGPGALLRLCTDEERAQPDGHRLGYRRRLVDTPGVIATEETGVDMPLIASLDRVTLPAHVEAALTEMRRTWETPNGETFEDALTMYRHVREMALGFFYFWDPPAPAPWLRARKRWFSACRAILGNNRRNLDSPLQVANAVDHGHYDGAVFQFPGLDPSGVMTIEDVSAPRLLSDWRAVRDSFEPRTVPAWLSTDVVEHVAARGRDSNSLIWVSQDAFAKELARESELPYYGSEGLDRKTGRSIEQDPGGRSVIVSMHSNRAGRNLQDRWSRNYIVNPPPNGEWIEQLLGRTHRFGQTEDEVTVEFLITCEEHWLAIEKCQADARYMRATLGQEQKILLADWT